MFLVAASKVIHDGLLVDPVCHSLSDAILTGDASPLGQTETDLIQQIQLYQRRGKWEQGHEKGQLLMERAPSHQKTLEAFSAFLLDYSKFLHQNRIAHAHRVVTGTYEISFAKKISTHCAASSGALAWRAGVSTMFVRSFQLSRVVD